MVEERAISIVVIRFSIEKREELYIFNDISYHVMLVQMIDISDNVNHDVSITGYWIYCSNYKQALLLIK